VEEAVPATKPGEHERQAVNPDVAAKVPTAQGAHEIKVVPVVDAEPAAQREQTLCPPTLAKEPAAHAEQLVELNDPE